MIHCSVSDGVCVLRLDSPPLNMIGFLLLDDLRHAIGRAGEEAGVRGIIITGGCDHFSAGADVGLFRDITRAEDAVETSRVFQDAFQNVEDSARPVVAAVAGRMMGSALELAMACHYRVCAGGARFRIYWEGMPIWGKLKSLSTQFLELATCIVASTYCNSWVFEDLDPDDPFRSMARAYSRLFICRSDSRRNSASRFWWSTVT